MSPGPSSDGPGRFLCLKHLLGASDRRAQAGLEPRIGRTPCSPATFPVVTHAEGTRVCGVHTTAEVARGTEETTGGSREDAARPADNRREEKREWSSESSYPASRPWCGPEPQAARTGPTAERQLVPRVRPVPHSRGRGTGSRYGRRKSAPSADGDTRPLPAKTGKLVNVAQDTARGTVTLGREL